VKRTPLHANPAKTAAFHACGRARGLARSDRPPTARSQLKRSGGLRRALPKVRIVTPPDVWQAVLDRDRGDCVWCGTHVYSFTGQPHHLLPKRKRTGGPEYVGTRANVTTLCEDCHATHEHSPNDRLPWAALPAECQAFLRQVAAADARAARFVRVKYPGCPP
jgi:hypothetical protein